MEVEAGQGHCWEPQEWVFSNSRQTVAVARTEHRFSNILAGYHYFGRTPPSFLVAGLYLLGLKIVGDPSGPS